MCHRFAVAIFDTYEDPIADFEEHDVPLLDSALQAPRQTFDRKDLYPTLPEKATVLYYHLNKNHPFKNGNKRIATASLLVFLHLNHHWLNVPKGELLEKTLEIAQSNPSETEHILENTTRWIEKNMVSLHNDS